MPKSILLNSRSKELIQQLAPVLGDQQLIDWNTEIESPLDSLALVQWLAMDVAEPEKKFCLLLESLRASLLKDLCDSSFNDLDERLEVPLVRPTLIKKALFIFLAAAGTLVAICQGFDGIASILSSFTSVSTMAIFATGVVFSVLSAAIFYGFELLEISRHVGVPIAKSGQLLDVFLDQCAQIKALRATINDHYRDEDVTPEQRHWLKKTVEMLSVRYEVMDKARTYYKEAFLNSYLTIARAITAVMTAMLYFSGGYFAGQTLALNIATLMFGTTITAASFPVLIASLLVGFSAAIVYWFVQRPGLENLVGHCVGFDKENIEIFTDKEIVDEQKRELSVLSRHIDKEDKRHQREELAEQNRQRREAVAESALAQAKEALSKATEIRLPSLANCHRLFKPLPDDTTAIDIPAVSHEQYIRFGGM